MDRGIWMGAVIGFLVPVVMFSPLNTSKAWFSAWQHPVKPAAVAAPAQPVATPVQSVRAVHARHRLVAIRRPASKPAAENLAQAPVLPALDPKEQLARTIDPAKRPDWYLIDPTLKRGDVLFLQDKVVIFSGRKIGDLADYVPVSHTRMLSRTERRRIETLASRPAPSVAEAPAAAHPNKAANAAAFGLRVAN